MRNDLILKRIFEGFMGWRECSPKKERQVSDRLLSLLEERPSLRQKLCDARMADAKTQGDLIVEILEEVRNPALWAGFHGLEPGCFFAELSEEAGGEAKQGRNGKEGKDHYRKVIRCTFEK